MTEFEYLKEAYTTAIESGFSFRASYNEMKLGNELLHHFCKNLVERSNYPHNDKEYMKAELELLKQSLEQQIEDTFEK